MSRVLFFSSLTDRIDTTTAGGRLVFHIMGALAGFERDLIQERTKAGLRAARKRGKRLGRPLPLPSLTPRSLMRGPTSRLSARQFPVWPKSRV
ncbi:MAG: recombinase family protein [Rhodospirillales bacterium]|nr:recombinase family protein [Rhodospirillales bacterium]